MTELIKKVGKKFAEVLLNTEKKRKNIENKENKKTKENRNTENRNTSTSPKKTKKIKADTTSKKDKGEKKDGKNKNEEIRVTGNRKEIRWKKKIKESKETIATTKDIESKKKAIECKKIECKKIKENINNIGELIEEKNKKEVRTYEKKCPECRSDLVTDYKSGEVYCKKCGYIIEDSMVDKGPEWRAFDEDQVAKKMRTGSAMKFTKQDKGLVTEIDRHDRDIKGGAVLPQRKALLYRLRKWQRRSRVAESIDRNLSLALPELDRMCTQLNLSKSIQEDCAYFYRRATAKGLTKGKGTEAMVAATIFLICKKHKTPQTLSNLRRVANVKRRDFGRCITILKRLYKNNESLIFCLDNIPGKDNKNLIDFLRTELNIPVRKKSKIEKTKDNSIIIENKDMPLILKFNKEDSTLVLETEKKAYEFIVKEEDHKLNVYLKNPQVKKIREKSNIIIYAEDYVPQFAERLSVPIDVEMEAIKILKEARLRGITVGKNPVGFAVAAIYLVCKKNDVKIPLPSLNDLGYVTIRKKYFELEEGLKDLIL